MAEDDGVDEELQAAMRLGATAVAALRERRAREVQAAARQAEEESRRAAGQDGTRGEATRQVKEAVRPQDRERGDLGVLPEDLARQRQERAAAEAVVAADLARKQLEQRYGAEWAGREDLPEVVTVETSHEFFTAVSVAELVQEERDLPLVMPAREVLHPEMKPLLDLQREADVAAGRPPVPLEWLSPKDVEGNPALADQWLQQQVDSGVLSPRVQERAQRSLDARRAGLSPEAVTAVQLTEAAQRTPGSAAVAKSPASAPRARKFLGRGGGKEQERSR